MAGPPQKLIRLSKPSVGFNGERILNKARTSQSYDIGNATSNQDMVDKVKEGVKHVVFNCHGFPATPDYPAHLAIGQTLRFDNVQVLEPWLYIGSLRIIWIVACNIGGYDIELCKKMAKTTRCYVSTTSGPALDRNIPYANCIEENLVMPQFINPDGIMMSSTEFMKLGGSLGFSRG
jgi:hypothetical protein